MTNVRVNVPLEPSGCSPEYLRYLQQIVQETVLRYAELKDENPED